jgi:hypothetical protein
MAGDCFAPIDICGVQVNRLDCDGTVLVGASNSVVMCEMVDFTITPQLVEAETAVSRNGGGGICAKRTTKARIDGYDVVWNSCPKIDAEAWELMNLYDLVLDTAGVTGGSVGDSVGIRDGASANPCNCITTPCQNPGVSMLVWTNNTDANGINATKPYTIIALPRVIWDPPAIAVTSAYDSIEITGRTESNSLWSTGPGAIYPELVGLSGAFAMWDTEQPPPGGCTCTACGFASGTGLSYGDGFPVP